MDFPVYIPVAGFSIHPHFLFELLAYSTGFQLYRLRSRNSPLQQRLNAIDKIWMLVGCVLGAAIGAKLLGWLETPVIIDPQTQQWHWLAPGKTIMGGLLGGWMGIETVKKRLHITESTGDNYIIPLVVGISLGRIGCFLTGLDDHTYGIATTWPWGVDFGDGVLRHPTQLYEVLMLLATGLGISLLGKKTFPNGFRFRLFMLLYLLFRFGIEFIKPRLNIYGGLSMLQVVGLLGSLYCGYTLYQMSHVKLEQT